MAPHATPIGTIVGRIAAVVVIALAVLIIVPAPFGGVGPLELGLWLVLTAFAIGIVVGRARR